MEQVLGFVVTSECTDVTCAEDAAMIASRPTATQPTSLFIAETSVVVPVLFSSTYRNRSRALAAIGLNGLLGFPTHLGGHALPI